MSKEIKVTVYNINELDEKAKAKVLDKYRYNSVDADWYHPVYDDFFADLERYGIEADIEFTGFYSQGDGASFITTTCDTDLLIRTLFEEGHDIPENALLDSKNLSVSIDRINSRYSHEETMYVDIHDEDMTLSDLENETLNYIIEEWAKEKARDLYRKLESYYEDLTSDKEVIEYLADCEFFQNGDIVKYSELGL